MPEVIIESAAVARRAGGAGSGAGSGASATDAARFAAVRPHGGITVLANSRASAGGDALVGELTVPLPEQYRAVSTMVEVRCGDVRRMLPSFVDHALTVSVSEEWGELRVIERATRAPSAGVYVKVFARHGFTDSRVAFYKDGFTDLRGRFDFTSLNTAELDDVARFSILVVHKELGACCREAAPPRRR